MCSIIIFLCSQLLYFVGPDLGPNCLQRLSADDTSRQRVKVGVVFRKVNYLISYSLETLQGEDRYERMKF